MYRIAKTPLFRILKYLPKICPSDGYFFQKCVRREILVQGAPFDIAYEGGPGMFRPFPRSKAGRRSTGLPPSICRTGKLFGGHDTGTNRRRTSRRF